jgi:iron-sulfur cluster assembly accessory protein
MPDKHKQTSTLEGQPPLIRLTDSAVDKIKAMMAREGKQDCGLRVAVVTGGCAGLSYDLRLQKKPYDNDRIVEQGDLRIFVNQESVDFLKGLLIDYKDTLKESGFQYHNPNARNSCGCGTSFS